MNNKPIVVAGILFIALAVLGIIIFLFSTRGDESVVTPVGNTPVSTTKPDVKNISYSIEGKAVVLKDGVSEVSTLPNSTLKTTTQYFGNDAVGDLNEDGIPDTAFLLTQNTGGSGTFYYVVVALKTSAGGYIGTNAILLGDRIAPQTTEIKDGVLAVNYAVRNPGEPMTTRPSMGKTMWIKVDTKTNQIVEWVKDFEGEANPSVMKLDMQTWHWTSTTYTNSQTVIPKISNKFALTFTLPNRFSASTDCNGVGGEYSVTGSTIVFTKMMSTMMYCQDSQEQVFSGMLGDVKSYHFTSKGELIFDLKTNGGQMIFR